MATLVVLYYLSQPPSLSRQIGTEVASRFAFDRSVLPSLSTVAGQSIRKVHPSLRHFAGWISFVGGAVSIGDLQGDGLADDIVHVDSRFDEVIVSPVPGTGERYRAFGLTVDGLPYEARSTAPMGTRVGDFDEDGASDILVYYWGRSPVLFLQDRGVSGPLTRDSFSAVDLVTPPLVWHTSSVTQADLDGDGHIDLVIGNYNPDGARTLDADATGSPEVMMGSWARAANGWTTRLLLHRGRSDGPWFAEATGVLQQPVADGWTFAVGAADLDADMLPELYLVHDFGADCLLHNRSTPGRLAFTELRGQRRLTTPRSMVLGLDTFNGMGVDFHDVNADGHLDILVSNITCDRGFHQSNLMFVATGRPELMRRGLAPFANHSESLGLSRGGWTWDTKFGDFDNDGIAEVLQANGFIKGNTNRWPEMHEMALANEELARRPEIYPVLREGDDVAGRERNAFFVSHQGRYFDVSQYLGTSGLDEAMLSRGIAMADVDGDGRLDLAYGNHFEESYFYRNTASGDHRFLGLRLLLPLDEDDGDAVSVVSGHVSEEVRRSIPAIGAVAELQIGSGEARQRMIGQVDGGNGHSGQRAAELHFGLGQLGEDERLSVSVRWRSLAGQLHTAVLDDLRPGWHTIFLGGSEAQR